LATPFGVSDDNRELYESAKFKFSLGGVNWSGRYAQPAQRLNALFRGPKYVALFKNAILRI